jgi:catechol 2,3-dioxygenase-like lactoylglutathione lyase family enzyme
MLPVTGCCFLVGDLERSVAFYTERVGFELARKAPGFAQYRPQGGVHVSTWETAHFCGATGLPGAVPRRLNKAMGGLLVASASDVEAAYEQLRGRGVAFPKPPMLYEWNAYAAYFQDPDGNVWEIYCWGAGGPPTEDLPRPSDERLDATPSRPPDGVRAPSPLRARTGPGAQSLLTAVPVAAICLLCHDLEALLPFYTERMGFHVRRRDSSSFVQFWSRGGVNLCLWEIGHVVRHIGFEQWPRGDTTGKIACTVRVGSRAEIDRVHRELTQRGVPMPHAPRVYPWNTYSFYFSDPDGNCWEIYHWLDGGPVGDTYQMTDPATMDRIVRSGGASEAS